jgi:nucleotide-binding universal stress UspA family protein
MMTYASLMVHVDLDHVDDTRLEVAAELAGRFDARVIGITAQAEPLPLYYSEGYSADFLAEQARAEIEKRLKQAEERFRAALHGRVRLAEWRAALQDPVAYIADHCRAADLLIIGKTPNDAPPDPLGRLNSGDLIMHAGRPVLTVPPGIQSVKAERIFVAWKDTVESRRAICAALPFLRACGQAIVAEIDEDEDPNAASRRVEDVVTWLTCHGVNAKGRVVSLREDIAGQLDELAGEESADLFVAGAYGHGRFREWVFGGVTRDLLKQTSRCHLLMH